MNADPGHPAGGVPGGGPPRRPPRWQWLLSGGVVVASVASSLISETLANMINSSIGSVTLPSIGLALAGIVVIVILEARSRRASGYRTGEPGETGFTEPPGRSATLPFTSGFTGRDEEVAWIVAALEREHAVAVVGRRGVGTSSCAVYVANELRGRFPHGQHYVDLRPGGRRLGTRQALTGLARAVGTRPPRSGRPAALAAAAAAIRDRVNDREVLLVVDNVDHPAQVGALLPPTSECRLLLAGTPMLARIDGVAARAVEEPGEDDAVELFAAAGEAATVTGTRRVDPRADPAVRELVRLCGRQPRMIRALGYRMARHGWRSGDLLAILRHAGSAPAHHRVPLAEALTPLTELDLAYAALSPAARRLFRLMSLAPGALDRAAVVALSGRSPGRLGRPLAQLSGEFVVGEPGNRYEIRAPLRTFARLHLRRTGSRRGRIAAQVRLLRHLARRAERQVGNLTAANQPVTGAAGAAGRAAALPFDDDPYAWFELHGGLLHALVTRIPGDPGDGTGAEPLPRQVERWWFRLAVALCGWYAHEDRIAEWAGTCERVLSVPAATDRPEIAGWAHNELGVLHRRQGEPQKAIADLTAAVAKRRRRGTAQARMNLGLALLDLDQVDDAIEQLELARRHRTHADRAGHALTDLALGAAHLARDQPDPAHHHLVRAANTFRSLGESRGYAAALTNLVLAQWQLGERLDAGQSWTAALREYDLGTDAGGRAATLLNAGAALVASGPAHAGQAYKLLSESRELRGSRRSAGLGRTLLHLGDAAELLGRPEEARGHWTDAADICAEVGDAEGVAAANRRLAG